MDWACDYSGQAFEGEASWLIINRKAGTKWV
jgi:hypothetical protein